MTCVFRSLTLLIVEISRHRNNRLGDLLAEKGLGVFLEFAQHHRGDFLRRIHLAVDFNGRISVAGAHHIVRNHLDFIGHLVKTPPDKTLYGVNRRFGVGHRLTLGGLPHENFACLRKCDNRRSRTRAFFIRDNRSLAAFHYRHTAVGGSKVNSKYFCHFPNFLSVALLGRRPYIAKFVPTRLTAFAGQIV